MRNWRFWLGLLISLAFLYWLVLQVRDFEHTLEVLREAQYVYLLPALLVYFAGVWVRAVRWHYLLSPTRGVPASRLFPVVVIGYMANDVLPARMGEFVRVYALDQREGIRKTTGLATVFVERVFDGLAMLAFMGTVALFVPFVPLLQQVAALTAALFVGLIAFVFALAVQPARTESVIMRLVKLLPGRMHAPLERLVGAGLAGLHVMRSGRAVAAVLGLSLLAWLCEAGMYYLIALGFFPEIPFYVMLLTVAVANLGTMIPSSPGYVGTFDALAVLTLGLFGVASGAALGYTAVLHLALIVPVTLLGFYYLWHENLSHALVGKLRGTAGTADPVGPGPGGR